MLKSISVVCCTRDRPPDLCRLVDSLVHARAQVSGLTFELLIIDDGELPDRLLQSLAERASAAQMRWVYHSKRQRRGLLRSRMEAVALATHDWVLFLDDDVEVEASYLARLVEAIDRHPSLVGLGGVDVLAARPSRWKSFVRIVFGLEPLRTGRLSWGGFPAVMGRALAVGRAFPSRRLYGCNMAFRRTALQGLRMLPGFEDYSLYEDAYLSLEAGRAGPLLIDPGLKVRHHHTPSSRYRSYAVGRMSILNHCQLARLCGAARWRNFRVFLAVISLIAWSIARSVRFWPTANSAGFDFARGQFSALSTLLRGRSPCGGERHSE